MKKIRVMLAGEEAALGPISRILSGREDTKLLGLEHRALGVMMRMEEGIDILVVWPGPEMMPWLDYMVAFIKATCKTKVLVVCNDPTIVGADRTAPTDIYPRLLIVRVLSLA